MTPLQAAGCAACVIACAAPPPAAPALPNVAATVSAPPASSAPPPYAPSFDQEMACRRAHCYTGGAKRCLDVCYKYNHPRRPQAHDRCNDNCRHNYDIEACENACARDRRAYKPLPRDVAAPCRREMNVCRKRCDDHAPNHGELACLVALEACRRQRHQLGPAMSP